MTNTVFLVQHQDANAIMVNEQTKIFSDYSKAVDYFIELSKEMFEKYKKSLEKINEKVPLDDVKKSISYEDRDHEFYFNRCDGDYYRMTRREYEEVSLVKKNLD